MNTVPTPVADRDAGKKEVAAEPLFVPDSDFPL